MPPSGKFRLFVVVTVQEHGATAAGGRNVDEQQRRASWQRDDLPIHVVETGCIAPAVQQLYRLAHIAMGFPIRIEHRRLVGDANVVG